MDTRSAGRSTVWSTMSAGTRRSLTLAWTVLFVLSLLMQAGVLANPPSALAVHDDGIFELDGNALDEAAAGDDWQNGTPGAQASLFIPGAVEKDGADTTYFAQGGSKDHHDIDEWHYSATDVAPDKDELIDVFAAAYDTGSGTSVYFGADKFDDSGDAQIGFWFFQGAVSLGANGLFNGVHTVGDVLVLSDFTNGGSVDLICVYEWNPPGDDIAPGVPTDTGCDIGDNLTLAAAGAECDVSGPDGEFEVCAIVNVGPADTSPWPFVNKDGATSFGAGQFFEGGINLDDLFGGDAPCFSGFLAETRSSQEVEAQLKDFALGNLDTCQPPTIATLASPSTIVIGGGTVSDLATFTGTSGPVTGSAAFFVCGPATPACATGGTALGSVTIVNGSATSAAFTPPSPGTYCFRVEYTPDAAGALNYSAGSHTNMGSECFTATAPLVPTLVILKDVSGNTGGTAVNGLPIAKVGDTLTYTLNYDIFNPPVSNGVITDPIPAGLEYVTGSATTNAEFDVVNYDAATRTLTWNADTVTVDGTLSFRVTVLAAAPALAQPIVNVATIDSDETAPDDDDASVLVQAVQAITNPPTSALDESSDQRPSNPGFSLMLILLALAAFALSLGLVTPVPERARRRAEGKRR